MVTRSVMVGRLVVGEMVHTPLPASHPGSLAAGMSKVMVSAPGAALASVIAYLSEPGPLSSVLVTVKVVVSAWAALPARSPDIANEATITATRRATLVGLKVAFRPATVLAIMMVYSPSRPWRWATARTKITEAPRLQISG